MNKLYKTRIIPVLVLMYWPPAFAEMDIDGMMKYRQSVMKALGGHTGAINRLVRGQVPLMDQLEMHVTAARDIAQTVTTLFPSDSIPPDAEFAGATTATEALAAIGGQPEFEKAAQKTIDATEQLVKWCRPATARSCHWPSNGLVSRTGLSRELPQEEGIARCQLEPSNVMPCWAWVWLPWWPVPCCRRASTDSW